MLMENEEEDFSEKKIFRTPSQSMEMNYLHQLIDDDNIDLLIKECKEIKRREKEEKEAQKKAEEEEDEEENDEEEQEEEEDVSNKNDDDDFEVEDDDEIEVGFLIYFFCFFNLI